MFQVPRRERECADRSYQRRTQTCLAHGVLRKRMNLNEENKKKKKAKGARDSIHRISKIGRDETGKWQVSNHKGCRIILLENVGGSNGMPRRAMKTKGSRKILRSRGSGVCKLGVE